MLSPAHVKIHGHPVIDRLGIGKSLVVIGVQVAQIIPAGTGPLGHGVGFALGLSAAMGAGGVHPLGDVRQGRFTRAGGSIASHLGQEEGKVLFIQGHDAAGSAVDHGNWFSPVPLAGEKPIPQLVVHRFLAYTLGFEPGGDLGNELRGRQAGKFS
ncbi:MAG: Uncharacterized protein FD137_2110 [Spirochaetes bacterium]|nr:MAG: Uncharacterized protein FD137_2110 [Spirochaetota bacterium]